MERKFLIRVGEVRPPIRMSTKEEVRLFLLGLMIGDGRGVDRAAATAEGAANCLNSGGRFASDNKITELITDDRQVYGWWEDVTS